MAMMRSSCIVLAFALVKGARVDDDEATGPSRVLLKQALNPDGSPRTITEKAAAGIPQAIAALHDAKVANDLVGPPKMFQLSAPEVKARKDEQAMNEFLYRGLEAKNAAEQEVAATAAQAAAAKAASARDKLELASKERKTAQSKQKMAAGTLDKAEVMHELATEEKVSAQSVAMASSISAAGASKAMENSKTYKDESEAKLADIKETAKAAKETSELAQAKLEHVYNMKAFASKSLADSQSTAKKASQDLAAASLAYDKSYAIHADLVPIATSTQVTLHAATEADAIATDKAFAAKTQAQFSKEKEEEATAEAKEAKKHSAEFQEAEQAAAE